VTERASRRKSSPKAAVDGSRSSQAAKAVIKRLRTGGPVAGIVLFLGLLAGVLLVVAELSTYREIDTITAACEDLASADLKEDCVTTGGEQHNWALILVALVTVLMAWGAGPGRSRPAALALCVLGALVLFIALALDLPDTDVTGAVGRNFDQASGEAGPAIKFEIVAAIAAGAAGGLRLLAARRRGP
jgi:hypothetical protein